MWKKRRPTPPFQMIDGAALRWVIGGTRITPRTGPPPEFVLGIQNLVKAIGEAGQQMQVNKQQQDQQMQQVLQQWKASRGG